MTGRRTELLKRLDEALRKVSAQSVLLSDTVARLVGLHSTDLECLDLLYLSGPVTAGRLAAHTGLTTGATTAVIDRLESGGYVRRTRDSGDRRRVMVEAMPAGIRRIEPLYERLAGAMARLHGRYDDRQLALVMEYLTQAVDLGAAHVAWLQSQRKPRAGEPLRRQVRRTTTPIARGRRRRPEASPA